MILPIGHLRRALCQARPIVFAPVAPSIIAWTSQSRNVSCHISHVTQTRHKCTQRFHITFCSLSTKFMVPARRKYAWCDVNQRSRPSPEPSGACFSPLLVLAIFGARVWRGCRVRRAPSQYTPAELRAPSTSLPMHHAGHGLGSTCGQSLQHGVVGSRLNNRRRHRCRAGPIRRRRHAA